MRGFEEYKLSVTVAILCSIIIATGDGRGLLILYRPRDISNDCVFSQHLRYDLSFGMGMSDTITLVLRTWSEVDYECTVEIASDPYVYLLLVIRLPNQIGPNCQVNPRAFTVLKKNRCLRLCDAVAGRDLYSPFFVFSVQGRFRFRFLSNSSINTDMNVNLYEVTATTARKKSKNEMCNRTNETICTMGDDDYCFTSGVVCDGIKNCGVTDWFDERKSECELPVHRLGMVPVLAVAAVIFCALLAAIHILRQCLPITTNSFFVFNANEDNRLCIDTVLKVTDTERYGDAEHVKRTSIIPLNIFSNSSSEGEINDNRPTGGDKNAKDKRDITQENTLEHKVGEQKVDAVKKYTMKAMSTKIQERLRSLYGRGKNIDNPGTSLESHTHLGDG